MNVDVCLSKILSWKPCNLIQCTLLSMSLPSSIIVPLASWKPMSTFVPPNFIILLGVPWGSYQVPTLSSLL
jgi:hypothetical protein